ncbi:SusC/RagA family TonB-linked outer membrane protein [Hymenobacter sp. BT491]|uniref:SusC/RagA family TonB-linked outer membrane protein n=1 Tax=Hymenobacter sp. BT491 TaxID=2766779 RepID=UPI001653540B|nr:TonB-dependent receptor [Hymenobacter sp. BT491]MBC6992310.1 TonB-dependent receptor [Hymenobacter sp. BT491]
MKKPVPKMRRLTIPALLCCLPLAAAAEPTVWHENTSIRASQADVTVSGRVLDDKGQPLPGVNVVVRGTSNGTQTNSDGQYTLTAPENATLVFSFVGYTSQEVALNGRTTVNVALGSDTKALNEVVVVGYLSINREQVTGSVSKVSQEDIRRSPVASVTEALQGRVAGVQVNNSGAPGQNPIVNIRGIGSIALNSNPLYVVDGVWTSDIRDINPSDIESTTILKDAASLAPYGSRGANGVILITTRRGKLGKPAINFNAYGGVQNIPKTYDLADTQKWADVTRMMYTNAGQTPFAGAANPPAINTDWQKALFQSGRVQNYSLGLSGASEFANYNISGSYFNQKGTIVGPKFDRYSLRLNSGITRGKFHMDQSAQLSRAFTKRVNGIPFIDVIRMLPIIPVYDPTTVSGFGFGNTNQVTFGTNPVGLQKVYNDTNTENRLIASLAPEINIFDFLRYRLNLGMEYLSFQDRNERKYGQAGGLRMNEPVRPAELFEGRGDRLFLLAENTLNFQKSFGNHNVNAVVGYTEQKNTYKFTNATAQGFGTGPTYYWSLGAATGSSSVDGGTRRWTKRSYLAQVAYDYDDRYLLTGAYRHDGSSLVDPANKWGDFFAFSGGWRISKEAFFSGVSGISDLKLRASYGELGNDQLPEYLSFGLINSNVNYPFNGTVVNGAIQNQLASKNLKWESRATTNIGFDLGLMENRVTLAADYYISKTKNALVNPAIPFFEGNVGVNPYTNLGRLENRGFEFQLGYTSDPQKDFRYGVSANLTTLKNRVKELAFEGQNYPGGPSGVARTEAGQPVGAFYLMHKLGIFQTQADVDAHKVQPSAKPGDVKYEDINGDGQITDADRRFTGSPFPKLQYGLNLNFGYKAFDLTAFLQGVQGNDIYNVTRYWTDRMDDNGNFRADLNPWTPSNPSTSTPRPLLGGGLNASPLSDRWLENGSYLRLKNVQLGYTLPKTLLERVKGIGSLRIYLTGQNLLTATKYTGYDPEIVGAGPLARGVDEGNYPNLRTVTAGIQLGF